MLKSGRFGGDAVGSLLELDVGVAASGAVGLAAHLLPEHEGHAEEEDPAQTEHGVGDSGAGRFGHGGHHPQFVRHSLGKRVDALFHKQIHSSRVNM